MAVTQGELMWTPPADARKTSRVGQFMDWLAAERGVALDDYDALMRWSVDDLDGFWGAVWDFFGVRAHTPYERVLSDRAMPGTRWFEGATLNYAEHMVGTDEDLDTVAVLGRSQTRDPVELTFAELREQVARARAGLERLGVGPGDRVVAYLPNIPETLVAFLATASLGAIWATCAPEFGARAVIDRFAIVEPKVLLAVAGYGYGAKHVDRRGEVAAIRAELRTSTTSSACPTPAGPRTRCPTRASGTTCSPSRPSCASTQCRSTTRCTCCSHPARPACRSRSCTVTAASSSRRTRTTA
jgi:acetoacetyl-CoA synthetase